MAGRIINQDYEGRIAQFHAHGCIFNVDLLFNYIVPKDQDCWWIRVTIHRKTNALPLIGGAIMLIPQELPFILSVDELPQSVRLCVGADKMHLLKTGNRWNVVNE